MTLGDIVSRIKSFFTLKSSPAVKAEPVKPKLRRALMLSASDTQPVSFSQAYPVAKPAYQDTPELAMDDNFQQQAYGYADCFGVVPGLGFLGYPYLAQLTQRAEFRMISEIRAEEMTRKWIEFQSTGGKADEDKITELTKALDDFKVRHIFEHAIMLDGEFGRSQIYIDTGATDDPKELAFPLLIKKAKIGKGALKGLRVVEPMWSYPQNYNAADPLKGDFYKPSQWSVQGKLVHSTRLLTIVSKPVPDILKAAYAFGGLSLTQIAMPYVDNWIRTRQSVSDLIHSFSMMILMTDMSAMLTGGGDKSAEDFLDRLETYAQCRDNRGMFAIDKDKEDMKNIDVPLSGLDELQAQSQEHMASVSRTPLVKLTGITPSGLNASSDGEIQVYYDSINAGQEKIIREPLTTVVNIVQLHLWGEIDPNITFKFVPLHQLSEKEEAEVRKMDADTDVALVAEGIIDPEEVRKRLAGDKDSPYALIDVEDVPERPEDAELAQVGNKLSLKDAA